MSYLDNMDAVIKTLVQTYENQAIEDAIRASLADNKDIQAYLEGEGIDTSTLEGQSIYE